MEHWDIARRAKCCDQGRDEAKQRCGVAAGTVWGGREVSR